MARRAAVGLVVLVVLGLGITVDSGGETTTGSKVEYVPDELLVKFSRVVRTVNLAAPSLRKRQIIVLARLPALSSGTLRREITSASRPVRVEGLAVGVR